MCYTLVMAFTDDEIEALRYYLGRADTTEVFNTFGLQFRNAIDILSPEGEDRVRDLLCKIQDLDAKIEALSADCLKVEKVDSATFRNPVEVDAFLRAQAMRHCVSVARILSIKLTVTAFGPLAAPLTTRRA